jgi:putative membrane protein
MDKRPSSSTTDSSNSAQTSETIDDWQVLSPIAILYFTASIFKHLFGNLIYLIPALAFIATD